MNHRKEHLAFSFETEVRSALRKRLVIWLTHFNEKGANCILDKLDDRQMFDLYEILKIGIQRD